MKEKKKSSVRTNKDTVRVKSVKSDGKHADAIASELSKCHCVLDVIKFLTTLSDGFKKTDNPTFASILNAICERLCLIHNRQAVFTDALKRALKRLQKRLDTSDAMTSVLISYVEAGVTKPYTFDETTKFEEFVDAVDKFNG